MQRIMRRRVPARRGLFACRQHALEVDLEHPREFLNAPAAGFAPAPAYRLYSRVMEHHEHKAFRTYTESERKAWRDRAAAQGLVCVVCGEIPKLERRPEFYDTGLCRSCATDLDAGAAQAGA